MNIHSDFETTTPNPQESDLLPDPPPEASPTEPVRRRRGFAAMDPNLVREISRKGGKAAHAAGTAHEFTSDEARAAGRKGGQATHAKRRERTTPSADATK